MVAAPNRPEEGVLYGVVTINHLIVIPAAFLLR
jgi:hypothetical protein